MAQTPDQSVGDRLLNTLRDGTFAATVRYRFEFVSDDASTNDAYASKLRTTMAYTTQSLYGFSAMAQVEDVSDLGAAGKHANLGFGNAGNGVTDRPVVADPPTTELLQAYGRFERYGITVTAGRQLILHDNVRFVGNVGWRQHQQSYDALRVAGTWRWVTADYAFIGGVRRIFGDRQDMFSHLLTLQVAIPSLGNLRGYAYLLDYDEPATVGLSTNTFGASLAGARDVTERFGVDYRAEYARQRDAADNLDRIRADYAHIMGGVHAGVVGLRAGFERLDGDPTDGQFRTPLATLHAFNGWVDMFLSTPVNGVEDLYVRGNVSPGVVDLIVVVHEFRPATGSGLYGREYDVQLTHRTPWGQLFGLRGGWYRATDLFANRTKIWAYSTWAF